MRIISGYFKGKKILTPKDIKTRPLKDMTKESIFNIIKHSNKFNIQIKNRLEILETKEPPERPSGIKVSSVDELIEKLKNEVGVI